MGNKFRFPFIALMVLFSNLVHADRVKTWGDLDDVQAETSYYKALAALKKAQSESQGGGQQDLPQRNQMFISNGVQQPPPQSDLLPTVDRIVGKSAKLRFADGSTMTVQVGDKVSSYKVTKVSLDEVRLTSEDGKQVALRDSQ